MITKQTHIESLVDTSSAFRLLSDQARACIVRELLNTESAVSARVLSERLGISEAKVAEELESLTRKQVVRKVTRRGEIKYTTQSSSVTKRIQNVLKTLGTRMPQCA